MPKFKIAKSNAVSGRFTVFFFVFTSSKFIESSYSNIKPFTKQRQRVSIAQKKQEFLSANVYVMTQIITNILINFDAWLSIHLKVLNP